MKQAPLSVLGPYPVLVVGCAMPLEGALVYEQPWYMSSSEDELARAWLLHAHVGSRRSYSRRSYEGETVYNCSIFCTVPHAIALRASLRLWTNALVG